MEEIIDNNPGTMIDIAPDGDVVLVVGQEKCSIRVHSLILKAASKPFSAMLGVDFKEGCHMIDMEEPLELSLPEDNAVGLKYICAVAHHQNKMVPEIMAADDVLGVAAMADKYDFLDAFRFASCTWLHPHGKGLHELMQLTAAALLFRNARAFKAITKELILNYSGSYISLWSQDLDPFINWKVFCMLEEERSSARLKFAQILTSGVTTGVNTGGCCHKCGWSSKYAFAYVQLLESRSFWPVRSACLSDELDQAGGMPEPVPLEESAACKFGYKHTVPQYGSERRGKLENLKNSIGLCLSCVLSGGTESGNYGISHEH